MRAIRSNYNNRRRHELRTPTEKSKRNLPAVPTENLSLLRRGGVRVSCPAVRSGTVHTVYIHRARAGRVEHTRLYTHCRGGVWRSGGLGISRAPSPRPEFVQTADVRYDARGLLNVFCTFYTRAYKSRRISEHCIPFLFRRVRRTRVYTDTYRIRIAKCNRRIAVTSADEWIPPHRVANFASWFSWWRRVSPCARYLIAFERNPRALRLLSYDRRTCFD